MKRAIIDLTRKVLRSFNIGILQYAHLEQIVERSNVAGDLELLLQLPDEHVVSTLRLLGKSKAQLRQDLFVLSELNFKRNGYFVEFGATNGMALSNTYMLEKEFGWTGILAEPARCWHDDLHVNRTSHVDSRCIWRNTGSVLAFNEVDIPELSSIGSQGLMDLHRKARTKGTTYNVDTVSLLDLLKGYDAPQDIDYLSIDTEGSEFEILNAFDFSKFQIRVITCEHNFTSKREQVFDLLTSKGYMRKFEHISRFDDWYTKHE